MAKLVLVASLSVVPLVLALTQEARSLTDSITLAGSIGTILAIVFAGIVNIIAARAAARREIKPVIEKVATVLEKVDEVVPILKKVDVVAGKIEAHVNSEKTRDQGIIATQKQEIDLLREVVVDLRKASALLAQAKQATDLTQAVSQGIGTVNPIAAEPVLKAIEKNTEDTVQALKDKA